MIIALVALVLLLCHWTIKLIQFIISQYRLYNALKQVPGPEVRLSLIGNLSFLLNIAYNNKGKDVSKEFSNLLVTLCDKYGGKHGVVRLWLGPFLPIVIICDAKVAQTIFNSPHYVDKASFYGIFSFAIGDGIFTCNSAKLKIQKKSLREHFKLRALEQYLSNTERHLQVFNQRVEKCIREHGGYFPNAKEIVSPFVWDTLGENLFSTEYNSQIVGEPKFVQLVHILLEISYHAFLTPWTYFFTNAFVRYLVNFKLISNAFRKIVYFKRNTLKIVRQRYERLLKQQQFNDGIVKLETKERISMLDTMINSRMIKSKLTRVHEIERQINTFVIAGHDTTTSSITWTLYLLAHHPEVRQKLHREIDTFNEDIESTGDKINLANIKRLKYLDCCIKESLRLYPSGPFIGRRGRQAVQISDEITLPANINVILFIHYIQTSEKYFREPRRFYPDRFMQNNDNETDAPWITNSALMPFSAGLRVCIGKEYGIMQQKLFMINLMSKYTFSALDQYGDTQPKSYFLLSAAHFPVQFHRRRTNSVKALQSISKLNVQQQNNESRLEQSN